MVSENKNVATKPAVSASGKAEITIWANVLAKIKNWMQRRRIRPWRSDD